MKYLPPGSAADRVCKRIVLGETTGGRSPRPGAVVSLLTPLDPLRQAQRLPIRALRMLSAHTAHLLHPEYLQPLTSAPVSIEVLIALLHHVATFCHFYTCSAVALISQQCGEHVKTALSLY